MKNLFLLLMNMVFLHDSYHIKLSSWKDPSFGEQSFKQDQPLTMYIQCANNVYSKYILTLQHSIALISLQRGITCHNYI